MVFSGLTFLLLYFPAFLIIYFLSPKKFKNTVLFLFSLLFYSWGEPIYVVLMLFSTVLDYTCGYMVYKHKGKKGAKIALLVSMIANIGLLAIFKYSDLILSSINSVFGTSIPLLNLPLPIGISFYTFQTMSYTIDIYRGDALPQKNIISFGAYVTLFPQLIAGPIVRYQTIADQLNTRTHSFDMFGDGVKRFVAGLGKKVLLANNIGLIWKEISSLPQTNLTVAGAWLGIIAFGLQLYFDFSGYSDMAIGLGKMLGFTFLENFDYPYISKSITEFWRRWHISLGTWFRDYIYIPLGGNRKGNLVQLRNIAIVWLLTGFWHGASWNYVLWGVYYGVLLIIEKFFLLKHLKKAPAIVGHIYTLFLVVIGWALFAIEDFPTLFGYMKIMFGFGGASLIDNNTLYLVLTSLPLIIIAAAGSTPLAKKLYTLISTKAKGGVAVIMDCAGIAVISVIGMAFLISSSYNPFLYFRF